MLDGFIRVAAASPKIKVGDVDYNIEQTVSFVRKAAARDTAVIVFPELGLTGYTCGDLFLQDTLLDGAKEALFGSAIAMAVVTGMLGLVKWMMTFDEKKLHESYKALGILTAELLVISLTIKYILSPIGEQAKEALFGSAIAVPNKASLACSPIGINKCLIVNDTTNKIPVNTPIALSDSVNSLLSNVINHLVNPAKPAITNVVTPTPIKASSQCFPIGINRFSVISETASRTVVNTPIVIKAFFNSFSSNVVTHLVNPTNAVTIPRVTTAPIIAFPPLRPIGISMLFVIIDTPNNTPVNTPNVILAHLSSF